VNTFPQKCNCVQWCRKQEEEESFMLSTKITLSLLLGMHTLFFNLSNFFVTLFIIICCLSLYLVVSHFSSLFFANLFFSLQNLFFRIFVHFFSPLFFVLPSSIFMSILCEYKPFFHFLKFKIIIYSFKMGDIFSLCIFF